MSNIGQKWGTFTQQTSIKSLSPALNQKSSFDSFTLTLWLTLSFMFKSKPWSVTKHNRDVTLPKHNQVYCFIVSARLKSAIMSTCHVLGSKMNWALNDTQAASYDKPQTKCFRHHKDGVRVCVCVSIKAFRSLRLCSFPTGVDTHSGRHLWKENIWNSWTGCSVNVLAQLFCLRLPTTL